MKVFFSYYKSKFALFLLTLMLLTLNIIFTNKLKNKSTYINKDLSDPLMNMSNEYYKNLLATKNTESEPEFKLINSLKDFHQFDLKNLGEIKYSDNKKKQLNFFQNQKNSFNNFLPNYEDYQKYMLTNILGQKLESSNHELYNKLEKNNRDDINNDQKKILKDNYNLNENEISFIKKNTHPLYSLNQNTNGRPLTSDLVPVNIL